MVVVLPSADERKEKRFTVRNSYDVDLEVSSQSEGIRKIAKWRVKYCESNEKVSFLILSDSRATHLIQIYIVMMLTIESDCTKHVDSIICRCA